MHHGLQLFCEPTWSTFSGLTSEYSRRRPAMWSAADTPANASALMSTLVEEGALGACAAAGAGAVAAVAVAVRGAAAVEEDEDDAPVNRMKGLPAGSGTTTGAALGRGAYCHRHTKHTQHTQHNKTKLMRNKRGEAKARTNALNESHSSSTHTELTGATLQMGAERTFAKSMAGYLGARADQIPGPNLENAASTCKCRPHT